MSKVEGQIHEIAYADLPIADSTMVLALADAAGNCEKHGAVAVLYLRSGAELRGKIDRTHERAFPLQRTVHIKNEFGGWATIASNEIIAVEVRKHG